MHNVYKMFISSSINKKKIETVNIASLNYYYNYSGLITKIVCLCVQINKMCWQWQIQSLYIINY